MLRHARMMLAIGLAAVLAAGGCKGNGDRPTPVSETPAPESVETSVPESAEPVHEPAPSYDKPGFTTEVVDGRLWVMRPGQEKSDKHATLIGQGPDGMTVKAPDLETAHEYLLTRPGFEVDIVDGRLWVLRPDQEKSDKHITLIGAGPDGMTVKALDKETAEAYFAAVE